MNNSCGTGSTFYVDAASHNFANSSSFFVPSFEAQLYGAGLAMSCAVVAACFVCAWFILLSKRARLDAKRWMLLIGVTLAAGLRLTWFALQFGSFGIQKAATVIDLLQHLCMIVTLLVLFFFYFIVVHSTFEHGTRVFLRAARIIFAVVAALVFLCFLGVIVYVSISQCFDVLDRLILFICGFQVILSACIIIYTILLSVLLQRHLESSSSGSDASSERKSTQQQVVVVATSSVLVGLGTIAEATLFTLLVTGKLQGFIFSHATTFYSVCYGMPVLLLSVPILFLLTYSAAMTDTKEGVRKSQIQNQYYLEQARKERTYDAANPPRAYEV
jgi:hypothetical protein